VLDRQPIDQLPPGGVFDGARVVQHRAEKPIFEHVYRDQLAVELPRKIAAVCEHGFRRLAEVDGDENILQGDHENLPPCTSPGNATSHWPRGARDVPRPAPAIAPETLRS